MSSQALAKYKQYLGKRYTTFEYVFNKVSDEQANIIVELGTSRSFVNGTLPGCMVYDLKYWNEEKVEDWDWGAGIFSRICAEVIEGTQDVLHTVDPSSDAINISKAMTLGVNSKVMYHQTTSTEFLRNFKEKIDLLYMDHHETCEEGAKLHLTDSKILIENNILSDRCIILIDDIHTEENKNRSVKKAVKDLIYGAAGKLGKGKYSIPYLLDHGFKISVEDYQVIMERAI